MGSEVASGLEGHSFARALVSSLRPAKVDLLLKPPAFTDDSFPAVFFTKEEARKSEEPLKLAIVAKCSYGRPSIPDIKSCLSQRLDLKGECIVSVLNPRHLLFRFFDEEDFLKVLVRKSLYLKGYLFRFFRWASDFDFSADPTLIPIWVGLPGLPVNLYNEDYLRCIADNFGEVLRIHDSTIAWTQTAEALVCVDVDIARPLPDRIWIGQGEKGYWQPVRFHRVPPICNLCRKLGHSQEVCKRNVKDGAQTLAPQQPTIPPRVPNGKIVDQEWRVVQKKGALTKRVIPNHLNSAIPVSNVFERLASNLDAMADADEVPNGTVHATEPVNVIGPLAEDVRPVPDDPSNSMQDASQEQVNVDVHGNESLHQALVDDVHGCGNESPRLFVVLPALSPAGNMPEMTTTVKALPDLGSESLGLGEGQSQDIQGRSQLLKGRSTSADSVLVPKLDHVKIPATLLASAENVLMASVHINKEGIVGFKGLVKTSLGSPKKLQNLPLDRLPPGSWVISRPRGCRGNLPRWSSNLLAAGGRRIKVQGSEKLTSISLDAGVSIGVHVWTLTPDKRPRVDANVPSARTLNYAENHAYQAYIHAICIRARFKVDVGKPFQSSILHGMSKVVFWTAHSTIINNSRWIIGDGRSVDFLKDIWLGQSCLNDILTGPYDGPPATVREVLLNANHHVRCLLPSPSLIKDLRLINQDDLCVWTPSNDGMFSTSSAYDLLAMHGVTRMQLACLWHPAFYRQSAIFAWKLLYRAVPVDSRISDQGLSTHANITSRFWQVLCQSNLSTPHGFINLYSTMLILWEIWRARCSLRFEGKRLSFHRITYNINFMISLSLEAANFRVVSPGQKLQDIYSLGFSLSIKHVSFKLIRWIPPSKGLVLNVDGASKGNPGTCGGGGCVRDCNGNLLFAFAHFCGFGSSLIAETRSLCDGLRLALDHSFHLTEIKSDSLTLVNSISSMKVPSWKCLHWWRDALSIIQTFDINIKHTYRQANQLADALANIGCSSQSNVLYFSAGSLPPSCKGPGDRSGGVVLLCSRE
ncbi:hypothetical protein Taro_000903 [Colocasia esculenta]|uniref:RNase H type-1 domain-containing protein n=1 Tax=Colocasia esculenta TaxID=4460 RepID=A0A843TEG0_COLES|nr:hypothetical protein [Colocasia esculenta]